MRTERSNCSDLHQQNSHGNREGSLMGEHHLYRRKINQKCLWLFSSMCQVPFCAITLSLSGRHSCIKLSSIAILFLTHTRLFPKLGIKSTIHGRLDLIWKQFWAGVIISDPFWTSNLNVLIFNKGAWNGKQILSMKWIKSNKGSWYWYHALSFRVWI